MLGGALNATGQVGRGLYDYYRYTPPMTIPGPTDKLSMNREMDPTYQANIYNNANIAQSWVPSTF